MKADELLEQQKLNESFLILDGDKGKGQFKTTAEAKKALNAMKGMPDTVHIKKVDAQGKVIDPTVARLRKQRNGQYDFA